MNMSTCSHFFRIMTMCLAIAFGLAACKRAPSEMPRSIAVEELAGLLGGEMLPHKAKEEAEFLLREQDEERVIALRRVVPLGPDTMAVLMRRQWANAEGKDLQRGNAHAESGFARVAYFKWQGSKWTVSKSPGGEVPLGSHGEFGEADVIELRPGLKALLIHHGGTWQGSSIEYGDLIPLDQGPARVLVSIALGSDNAGACGPDMDCWDATSAVSFKHVGKPGAMPEIHVQQTLSEAFSPYKEEAFEALDESAQEALRAKYEGQPKDLPRRTVVSHAHLVYKWKGKKFELVSGQDIVPGI